MLTAAQVDATAYHDFSGLT